MTAQQNQLDVLTHLQACQVEGNFVVPPAYDIPRPIYNRLKLAIEGIGGKWITKHQAFKFKNNPQSLFRRIAAGETINLERAFKKRTQYFPTPKLVMDMMADISYVGLDYRVLEPSAGEGSMCDYLTQMYSNYNWSLDVCELEPTHRQILLDKGYNVVGEDFMNMEFPEKGYQLIWGNPPFFKESDIQHVMRMYELLAPGGRLVSVMSAGSIRSESKLGMMFDEFFLQDFHNLIEVPAGAFKSSGTAVNTVIFSCDKPLEDPYLRPEPDHQPLPGTLNLF